jgi:8-oxo-dGTP pyrophosphatase MutT (NUDIX family)
VSDADPPAPEGVVVGPWRRLHREVVYENPWVTIYHDSVTRPDGEPGIYGVVHFASTAVGVVAIDDEDQVALVGQHRYTLDRSSWELPEGGSPPGEDPLDGARRELLEETGVRAREWRLLGRYHLSNSVSDEEALMYLATDLVLGESTLDGTEADLTMRWVPFAEVMAMVARGEITDAMSVLALQRVALDRSDEGVVPPASRTPRAPSADPAGRDGQA